MDRLLALLALLILAGFLGILVAFVPSIDLIAVVGLTLALAVFDMYRSTRRRNG